jgi:hypothetical protein
MKTLRLTPVALLALCLLAPRAAAQTRAEFDRIVDFSISLKTLSDAAAGRVALPSGRLVLIEGTVGEMVVLDDRPSSWTVRVELVAGEWIGADEVRGYRCWVTFSGRAFLDAFPGEVPEEPTEAYVPPRARVLVLGRPVGPVRTPLGDRVMSVEGLAVRLSR